MNFGLFLEFPRREEMTDNDAFAECFSLVDLAEELGVGGVWLAEYHFNPGRVLASPVTIAAAIAGRTQNIRVGIAVQILPLGNPVRIAEEVATLDHVSQGRVEFGVGRGTFPNVHEGFGSPFHESRARFDESLEIILSAWTKERFTFEGDYYSFQDLCVTPKPLQKPHPPIHVGITSAETFPIAGSMGYPILINPSRVFGLMDLAPHIQKYREAWKSAGHQGEPGVGLRVPIYLADTAEAAYSEPEASAMFSVRRLGERVGSYQNYGGTTGDWKAESEQILNMSYDDWFRDKVVYGTPDAVADRIRQLQEELTLTTFMYEINYGSQIPYERQVRSLKMFNEKVLPQLT